MALAVLSLASPSAAQPEAPRAALVVIRGDGAQDCPESAGLAERVRRIAGADVLGSGPLSVPSETWVQVAISHGFSGYSAIITSSGKRHGTRTLEDLGPGCASLADAIAVTIAIFLDPYANAPALATKPADVTLAPTPRPARPVKPPKRIFLDASAGFALNLLAHSKSFVSGSLGLRVGARWSLALGGSFVFKDSVTDGGGEVDLSLGYGYLLACGRALGGDESARLDWCVAPLAGLLRGSGRGYQNDASEGATWLAFALGPRAVFPFARSLAWVLAADGVLPLATHGFDVQVDGQRSQAFRSSSVAGLMSLGMRGEF